MDDLVEDERIIAGATVGPWKDAERYGAVIADAVPWMIDETERKEYGGAVIGESMHPHNRAFIIRARTRWPALVQEVRELREATSGVIGVIEELVKELKMLSDGEQCDHSVNICWCSTFYLIDAGQKAIARIKIKERRSAHHQEGA